MKSMTALFAMSVLSVFIIGQTWAPPAQGAGDDDPNRDSMYEKCAAAKAPCTSACKVKWPDLESVSMNKRMLCYEKCDNAELRCISAGTPH